MGIGVLPGCPWSTLCLRRGPGGAFYLPQRDSGERQRAVIYLLTRAGQKAYLYHFTYAETGKRAPLGAYHGEELSFLSGSFPDGWEHSQDDEALGNAMRHYWTQFAKSGDPSVPGSPEWPA